LALLSLTPDPTQARRDYDHLTHPQPQTRKLRKIWDCPNVKPFFLAVLPTGQPGV
jgi:hypothetical protein